MRIGLIGIGAIASDVVFYLQDNEKIEITGALVLPDDLSRETPFPLTTDYDEFMFHDPELVIECAGHGAVSAFGVKVLEADKDLMIVSIGALSDASLYESLVDAAKRCKGQLILPAGALIGVDGLAAARSAGLENVTIRSVKPPLSWSGAQGVEGMDLAAIKDRTTVFSGSAREAARLFPKNANVAATTALAGIGFEKTKVELVADPMTSQNTHTLIFEGAPGSYELVIAGNPSPNNPKTSQLTALSIVRLIENRVSDVVV
jgi:aspartate dehydrogenase